MAIERLWAGWRASYLAQVTSEEVEPAGDRERGCVFCRILASDEPDSVTHVVWRGSHVFAILNLYPYSSGHLLVLPYRHVGELESLAPDEATELWATLTTAVVALKKAFGADGVNVGVNLGRAAGAGVLGHVHAHAVPRWLGDTNFVTTVAEARVVPEPLDVTASRLRSVWPTTG